MSLSKPFYPAWAPPKRPAKIVGDLIPERPAPPPPVETPPEGAYQRECQEVVAILADRYARLVASGKVDPAATPPDELRKEVVFTLTRSGEYLEMKARLAAAVAAVAAARGASGAKPEDKNKLYRCIAPSCACDLYLMAWQPGSGRSSLAPFSPPASLSLLLFHSPSSSSSLSLRFLRPARPCPQRRVCGPLRPPSHRCRSPQQGAGGGASGLLGRGGRERAGDAPPRALFPLGPPFFLHPPISPSAPLLFLGRDRRMHSGLRLAAWPSMRWGIALACCCCCLLDHLFSLSLSLQALAREYEAAEDAPAAERCHQERIVVEGDGRALSGASAGPGGGSRKHLAAAYADYGLFLQRTARPGAGQEAMKEALSLDVGNTRALLGLAAGLLEGGAADLSEPFAYELSTAATEFQPGWFLLVRLGAPPPLPSPAPPRCLCHVSLAVVELATHTNNLCAEPRSRSMLNRSALGALQPSLTTTHYTSTRAHPPSVLTGSAGRGVRGAGEGG